MTLIYRLGLAGVICTIMAACSGSSYIKENQLLVSDGKGQIAVSNYQAYIQERPNDSSLYYHLAGIYYQLKDYGHAEKNIRKAIILEEQVAFYRLLAGKIAFQQQDYFSAISYLTSTLVLDNTLLEGYYYLALSYEKTGKISLATEQLASAVALEPLYFDARLAQVRISFEQYGEENDFTELISELKEALKVEPKSAEGILLLSRLYYIYGETYKAREVLEEWLKKFDLNDDVLYHLANLQFSSGLRAESKKSLQKITAPDLKARVLRLKLKLSVEKPENLLKDINGLIQTYGVNTDVLTLQGKVYLKSGQLNKAERVLQKAVQNDSKNSQAHIMLSKVWELQGDLVGAGRALENALEANPTDFDTRIYYLNKLVEMGELDRTVEVMEKYQLDENNSDVLYLKAVLADYQGDFQVADQYLNRAQREAYSPRIEVQLARSEMRRGRLTAANSRLNRLLKLYPNYYDAVPVRGELLYRKRNFSGVINYLTPYLSRKSSKGKIHLWLAESYLQRGNFQKAAAILKAGLTVWPSQIELIQSYTMVLGVLKQYKSAIKLLEEAQMYNHRYRQLFHSRLIQYYYYTGQTGKLNQYQYKYRVTGQNQRFTDYLYKYMLKQACSGAKTEKIEPQTSKNNTTESDK